MPLHVNLYHEIQRQELARQRDPLRLGMLAVLVIAIGFVVNYFIVMERGHSVAVRYNTLNDEWTELQPKATAAKSRQDELNSEIAASAAMMQSVESRLLWAPVLDEILKTVPRTVQLTHLSAEAPSNDKATNSTLSVSGLSSAVEPRKEAENLRMAMGASLGKKFKHVASVFKSLDDSDQYVMLDGRRLPTASFTIDFDVQVRDAASDPAAPAAAATRRVKEGAAE
jgi:Tfp pilus assembly protein PilN